MTVVALFFLSGLASLVLETVFRRELTLYVGSAVTATSLTLATFLGGLAWGAAALGRRADDSRRPLRVYAFLELGVGATSAVAIALLAVGREALLVPVRAAGPAGFLATAAVTCVLLLPPTFLMGGTLPTVTRYALDAGGSLLGSLATLYGANTLGAAVGSALAGFVLFEAVGISASGWLGAGLAGAVGAAALALDARVERARPKSRAPMAPEVVAPRARRAAIAVATIGGVAALGYEVVWTRLLVLPLRSYAYSFSLMLSLFLLGLVLGSLLLARFSSRINHPLRALALLQSAAGVYVAASVAFLPALLTAPPEGSGLLGLVWTAVLRASPLVLPPTILSGMALPLAVQAFAGGFDSAGRRVGAVYAANTLGAIVGALAAGLWILPTLGASRGLAALAVISALAGAIAMLAGFEGAARLAGFAVVAGCALSLLIPMEPIVAAYARPGGARGASPSMLFYREGATDTVAVVRRDYGFRDPEAKSVIVNGIAMTATVKPVWRYMAAEGHLPALFAPAPTRGLVICVGTGITLGALASHDTVTSIDAVDLSEGVLAALPLFDRENRAAYRDPKVHLIHADGRHFLELQSESYGLITVEPPPPIVAGSVHLYTLDFYRLCRRHLANGGVVAQWLPLHAQSLESAKSAAKTFLAAFPHVELWLPSIRDAVLLGSDAPLRLDPDRLRAAFSSPTTKASLAEAYFEKPEALLGTYLLDREGVAAWSAGADLVTDDRPRIEFFLRYGRTMSDHDIATLLDPPPGSYRDLFTRDVAPALRAAIEDERGAHRLYVLAESDKDAQGSQEAALTTKATRFGLYRLGCDAPQLEALHAVPGSDAAWQKQVAYCRKLVDGLP